MASKPLNYNRIARLLSDRAKLFEGAVVKVGLPAGKNYPDGTSIAYIGAIQEYGAPEQHIPPRPFMRLTRAAQAKNWAKLMTDAAQAIVQRKVSLNDALDVVGNVAAMDIVQTIANRVAPPLAPATVRARIRRARKANPKFGAKAIPLTISQPLVDTGALVSHIAYGVGKAGENFTGGTTVKK